MNETRESKRDDELGALLAPLERVQPVSLPDGAAQARRSRRSYLARRLVPVVALAAAVFALVMVAPWQHGPASSIMQRAAAAIGDEPILHAVLRDENASDASFFDLKTGRETRFFGQREIWYDKSGRRFFARLGNESDGVFTPSEELLVAPNGASSSQAGFSVAWSTTDVPLSALVGFFDGYRSALEDGDAHVTGSGELNGQDVSWIEWAPEPGSCPYSQPYRETSACTERVAIDEVSSLPVQIAWLHGGTVSYAVDILSIETLPAGSFDFSKPKPTTPPAFLPRVDGIAETDLPGAAEALPGALWPGRSISSLELTGVSRATLSKTAWMLKPTAITGTGIELRYGSGNTDFLWSEHKTAQREDEGGVVIHEQRANSRVYVSPSLYAAAPAGSLLTDSVFDVHGIVVEYRGWLEKDGIWVEIAASSRELLLEAARALKPIDGTASQATR